MTELIKRVWVFVSLGVITLAAVYALNGGQWFTYLLNTLATSFLGISLLYLSQRFLIRMKGRRTHELEGQERLYREVALVVAAGIIIGCSVIS